MSAEKFHFHSSGELLAKNGCMVLDGWALTGGDAEPLRDAINAAIDAAHQDGLEQGAARERELHREQVRHWLRVASWFGEAEVLTALLHDAAEDGYTTLNELSLWFGDLILPDTLDALTRRSGESYDDFIARVADGPTEAARIKTEDLKDNLARMDEAHEHNREKYEKALAVLLDTPAPTGGDE